MARTAATQGLGDLRSRLLFVVGAIFVYRLGTHIPIPGIHPDRLAALFAQTQGTVVELFNMFSGGALERMSVFALNIMPYISAAIVMQLLSAVHPQLQALRKEGERGRRQINQYTRYGTVVLAFIQATAITLGLESQGLAYDPGTTFRVVSIASLVAGTVFLMWLGEQITEKGVGNGISILIFVSIVAGIPSAIGQTIEQARQGDLSFVLLLALLVFAVAVVGFVVFMERGQRHIQVLYASRGNTGAQKSSSLPLKVNMSGVIPAIFASSLLLFPASASAWFGTSGGWLAQLSLLTAPGSPLYVIVFIALVFFFCYMYTALMFSPKDVSANLKRSGALLRGVRPGAKTAEYIDGVISRLTFYGATYISAVCLLPLALIEYIGVSFYFGGTSLLIVVVVVMDFMAQIQAHLTSSRYAGLMEKSSLSGKRGTRGMRVRNVAR